jgi:predicted ArsR family transcriptional regulator
MLTRVTEEMPGRVVTDPLALRALSHPLRWKLLELLRLEDSATATRCAEFTGESVASCSYHLGILAKYGFVEPAEGGRGREKPWQATDHQLSISTEGLDPEAALAAETVSEVFLDHETGRMKEALRRFDREPAQWRELTGSRSRTPHLTVEELAAVKREIWAVMDRYAERERDPGSRPPGARPVRLMFSSYLPLPPPPEPEDDA